MNYKPTTEKLESENYPYGYTLRTTKFDFLEFKKGKGFRHVSQTINPKTGKLNAPKNGTYSPVILLGRDENNHVKSKHLRFYGKEGINKDCQFMAQNYNLFTQEQIKDIFCYIVNVLRAEAKAMVIYCGSEWEQVKPIIEPSVNTAIKGFSTGENLFAQIVLDEAALEATKKPDFNPFTVTSY
jgi:hypothetical protein